MFYTKSSINCINGKPTGNRIKVDFHSKILLKVSTSFEKAATIVSSKMNNKTVKGRSSLQTLN
jgi:hypothetical protein